MRLLLFFALTVLTSAPLWAQPSASIESDRPFWFTVGFGRGAPHEYALSFAGGLGEQHGPQVGYYGNSSATWWGPDAFANAFGFTYGIAHTSRSGRLSASAGPSYVWGQQEAGGYQTVGVMTTFQVLLLPSEYGGVGVQVFGNLNREQVFGGLLVSLGLRTDG